MADIILERDDWIPKDTDKAQMFTIATFKIILEVPAIAQAREIGKKKHKHLNVKNKTAVSIYKWHNCLPRKFQNARKTFLYNEFIKNFHENKHIKCSFIYLFINMQKHL